jgi:chorismate dehydratase
MRIGAVNYLNSKPLVEGLPQCAPQVRLLFDLPSRLADSLAAGRLDVALIPSVEFFRTPGYAIVSDACVACRGPVLSVKLHLRVPAGDVRRLALDEGSRTSAALAQILLAEQFGVRPALEKLPIGCSAEASDADAVLLIGDRAMAGIASTNVQSACHNPQSKPTNGRDCVEVWDLGEMWHRWTGLPFVFAMWVARPDVDLVQAAGILAAARDRGVGRLEVIAAREAAGLGIDADLAVQYLTENLHFTFDEQERLGLRLFYDLCVKHGLAPAGLHGAIEVATKKAQSCDRH